MAILIPRPPFLAKIFEKPENAGSGYDWPADGMDIDIRRNKKSPEKSPNRNFYTIDSTIF